MDLKDYVALRGLPGIYKMIATRSNGLIVEDLETGKKKFASSRKHQFSPLASIGIYITGPEDTLEIAGVFRKMLEQIESTPPVSHNSSPKELMQYFKTVLPEYDEDRVSVGDIKKVIKWFTFLNNKNLLSLEKEEEKEEKQSEEEQKKEVE